VDLRGDDADLLRRIKSDLPVLSELLDRLSDQWSYEDPMYRFYHHSFKVLGLQDRTEEIVAALRRLQPLRELNPLFLEVVAQGTGKEFQLPTKLTRPTKRTSMRTLMRTRGCP
jgi:hypothetical protein